MNQKQELIEYLKQYRHDWLNHIQIIKGYLALDKLDQAQKFLDQVIINAHYESKISQLGDIDLSYFLLTYNWKQDKVLLEVEIEQEDIEICTIGKDYPYLLLWLQELTQLVEENCQEQQENRLSILFECTSSKISLTTEFIGKWDTNKGRIALERFQNIIEGAHGSLRIGIHNESEFSLEIEAAKVTK